DALALVDVGGDAAAVVCDRHRAVGVEDHLHQVGVAGERLVDGVVDHLIYHVVQARAVVGVADVHARAFAHRVQALQDLDGVGAVGGLFGGVLVARGRGLVGHICGRIIARFGPERTAVAPSGISRFRAANLIRAGTVNI